MRSEEPLHFSIEGRASLDSINGVTGRFEQDGAGAYRGLHGDDLKNFSSRLVDIYKICVIKDN